MAVAATPTFKGTVGPGFTIVMPKKPTKAGKIKLVVSDKASDHNFRLKGPGVNVATSVSAQGNEDVHRDAEEGEVHVPLRPARDEHDRDLHDQVARAVRAAACTEGGANA